MAGSHATTQGEDDTVVLYQMNRSRFVPNISPPCMKLELFLRLNKIPHRVVASASPGPHGRWPWIEHRGKTIVDSRRIVAYLKKHFSVTMDDALTGDQLATGTMLRRMVEEHMYWTATRFALVDRVEFTMRYSTVGVPDLFLRAFYQYVRQQTIDQLNAGTVGDASYEEYQADWLADVVVVSQLLQKHSPRPDLEVKFILGTPRPTTYDCVLYAQLCYAEVAREHNALRCPANDFVLSDPWLQAYLKLMRSVAWPDWDELLAPARAMPVRRPSAVVTLGFLKAACAVVVAAGAYVGYTSWCAAPSR